MMTFEQGACRKVVFK